MSQQDQLYQRIAAAVLGKYGDLARPSFRFVIPIHDLNPYAGVKRRLSQLFTVSDHTDLNADVATHLYLTGRLGSWHLALSYVGPFAILTRILSNPASIEVVDPGARPLDQEDQIIEITTSAGLTLVNRQVAETPIPLSIPNAAEDGDEAVIYHALFRNHSWLPWHVSL
jgi:hypothetical protein